MIKYNETSAESIEKFAKLLIWKRFSDFLPITEKRKIDMIV